MSLPTSDTELISSLRAAATELQVRASLYAERADDMDVRDYLQEFANYLDDAISGSFTPAERALESNERLRDQDPKARREFMAVETESPE